MENKKHILVIAQYFHPEQFRINDICTEWIKRGYKVTVVTGIPNYPQGRFYKGYGWFKNRYEIWNGIEIIRIPLISRGHSSIKLALNYFSFVVSGWFWSHFTKINPSLIFIYEVSPITQALVGVWLAERRKIPCHIYVTDLWPDNFEIITGIRNRLIIGPIEKLTKRIYKGCDKIFTSSESFIGSISKLGVPKNKLIFWPQYAEDFYKPVNSDKIPTTDKIFPINDKFKILFAGNIGEAQGLGVLIDAAKILREKGKDNIQFCIVGDGRYKNTLIKQINDCHLNEFFVLHSKVPATVIPNLFAQTEASLICLSKNEVFAMTIPAKTQSCLACGKPIIVCADGEIRDIIQKARCGVTAAASDANGLAEMIICLANKSKEELDQLSANARNYYCEHFDKNMLLNKMDQHIANG